MRFWSDRDLGVLLRKCQEGDHEAWRRLVEQHQSLVYSIARRYGLSEDDSADVFQQTFQALYSSLDRIQNGQTLPKWLAVTASREALRTKRINSKNSAADLQSLEEVIADEEDSAETGALEAIGAEMVRQGVAELGSKCRELLTLLYFEEKPYNEVSEILGTPMGAIGPTRSRCIEKLRVSLRNLGFFEEPVSNELEAPLSSRR